MNAFESLDALARERLGTAVQIPGLMANLSRALSEHHGDTNSAATDDFLVRNWTGVAFETRSAVLLMLAWGGKEVDLPTPTDTAGLYAQSLHSHARALDGDGVAFAGTTFPRMPFPGPAGALASWIGFDRDDEAGLEAALILMASMQRRLESVSLWP